MNDSAKVISMELNLQEQKHIDFWIFETWMGHYADHIRNGDEEKYKAWLVETANERDKSYSATAKAVYKWGPRMDIAKMP